MLFNPSVGKLLIGAQGCLLLCFLLQLNKAHACLQAHEAEEELPLYAVS